MPSWNSSKNSHDLEHQEANGQGYYNGGYATYDGEVQNGREVRNGKKNTHPYIPTSYNYHNNARQVD